MTSTINIQVDKLTVLAPHLGISYSELMINAGYIQKTTESKIYCEEISKGDNKVFDETFRMANNIRIKNSELLKITHRVVSELCDDDIKTIKNIDNLYLNQN